MQIMTKKKGWLWFHPGRPPGTILLAVVAVVSLATHPSPVEEVGFWRTNTNLLRSVWACTKPKQFPIPYLHFTSNNIQGRILYC